MDFAAAIRAVAPRDSVERYAVRGGRGRGRIVIAAGTDLDVPNLPGLVEAGDLTAAMPTTLD